MLGYLARRGTRSQAVRARRMTVTVRKSFEVLLNFERLFYSIILSESVQKVRFVLINIFRQTETLLEHVFSLLHWPS